MASEIARTSYYLSSKSPVKQIFSSESKQISLFERDKLYHLALELNTKLYELLLRFKTSS